MEAVKLNHGKASGTSCEIHPCGATLTSWKVAGQEIIFVSSKAVLDGSKAIRGGIPICFPQFGPWEFGPQHGFARSSKEWKVSSEPKKDENSGDVTVTLCLEDSEASRKVWNKNFRLLYKVTLSSTTLSLEAEVTNTGQEDFSLTFCFHTYVRVPDVEMCRLKSFKGLTYKDKTVEGQPEKVEDRDVIEVKEFTDRIYYNAPDCSLEGLGGSKKLLLEKSGLDDFTVWNPWDENKLADLGDNDYKTMLCVEATQASKVVELKPNSKWNASHKLSLVVGSSV